LAAGRKKKHVKVFLLTGDYPPVIGGVSSHVNYLANELVKVGAQVTVLAGGREPGLPSNEIVDGVRIHRVDSDFRGLPCVEFEGALKAALELTREILPDVVHAHQYAAAMIGLCIRDVFNIPLVVTVHTTPKVKWNDMLPKTESPYSVFKHLTKSHVDVFIAPSKAYLQQFLDLLQAKSSTKVRYIPHGIPIEKFSPSHVPALKSRILDDDDIVILSPARLDTRKDLQVVVRAMGLLKPKIPNRLKLWITGEPRNEKQRHYVEELYAVAEHSGLTRDDIIFQTIPEDGLPSLYKRASVCVLPSEREGLGLVLLEAMASKTPVVATRTIGIEEVVQHERTGLWFEYGYEDRLADQMYRVLNNKELRDRIVEGAYELVTKRHNSRLMAGRHLSVYRSLVSK
jgi:glycosyltransferase involved in cell wall biosynthesis